MPELPRPLGKTSKHDGAIELAGQLARLLVLGTGEPPVSFVALMLCTCRRWDRVTSRLIAAVEDSGLLDSTGLDELAESFLSHEQVIAYPLAWVSPQWLEVDVDDGHGRTCTVDEDTRAHHRVSVEPPFAPVGGRARAALGAGAARGAGVSR